MHSQAACEATANPWTSCWHIVQTQTEDKKYFRKTKHFFDKSVYKPRSFVYAKNKKKHEKPVLAKQSLFRWDDRPEKVLKSQKIN